MRKYTENLQKANFVYVDNLNSTYHIIKNRIGPTGTVDKNTFETIFNEIKSKYSDDTIFEFQQLIFNYET